MHLGHVKKIFVFFFSRFCFCLNLTKVNKFWDAKNNFHKKNELKRKLRDEPKQKEWKSILRKCFFVTHIQCFFLSYDKHVSFHSIYMGKLLKLIEKFLLAQTLRERKRGNFQIDAMRYFFFFSIEFHRGFFVSMVLMFDVTQFPCFVSFPFAIQFSFDRKIWQKWQFSSWKILSFAQQYTVTPLTYHFLLLD